MEVRDHGSMGSQKGEGGAYLMERGRAWYWPQKLSLTHEIVSSSLISDLCQMRQMSILSTFRVRKNRSCWFTPRVGLPWGQMARFHRMGHGWDWSRMDEGFRSQGKLQGRRFLPVLAGFSRCSYWWKNTCATSVRFWWQPFFVLQSIFCTISLSSTALPRLKRA